MESIRPSRSRGFSIINSNASSYNLFRLLLKELELEPSKHNDSFTEKTALISSNGSFEQIMNMIKLPFYLEGFVVFGLLTCLNSFLRLLIILPLKLVIDLGILLLQFRFQFTNTHRSRIQVSRRTFKNMMFVSLIIASILAVNKVDTSKIYHTIRAQSSIKLYVLFGVLEISDKLLSTVGQDALNYTMRSTQSQIFHSLGNFVRFATFFMLSFGYLTCHTLVLIYQTIALNVAANSYSNSLLTLLLSNQFAEIKSAVFKKIDKEGLFQMSCADVVERFQLLLMLIIISLRNLVQIGSAVNSNDEGKFGLLPYSISWNYKFLGVMLGPTAFVIGSELIVDWVKHSYICKFNKFRPTVYDRFVTVLSGDVIENFKTEDERVQQRFGLPLPALFVLFIVMSKHSLKWVLLNSEGALIWSNLIIMIVVFIILLLSKLLLELSLLKWSNSILKRPHIQRQSQQQKKTLTTDYSEGYLNGGMATLDNESRMKLFDSEEELTPTSSEVREKKEAASNKKLAEVTRYEMHSKRIW